MYLPVSMYANIHMYYTTDIKQITWCSVLRYCTSTLQANKHLFAYIHGYINGYTYKHAHT